MNSPRPHHPTIDASLPLRRFRQWVRAAATALVVVLFTCGPAAALAPGARSAPVAPQDFRDDSAFRALWTPFEGTRPAHWRVVWHDDPRTRASVLWSTREASSSQRLILVGPRHAPSDATASASGRDGARADGRIANLRALPPLAPAAFASDALGATVFDARSGPYTPHASEGSEPLGHHHGVRLTDLAPGARYDFVIESGGERSSPLYFITAPAEGTGFAVLYGGDSRTGWRDRCRVNRMIAALAASDPAPLCFVHGGDYVERGDRSAQWLRWASHHELTTCDDGRVLPLVPARGNHDWGPVYAQMFDRPGRTASGGGAWFRCDLGRDVALLTLDTNVSALGDQFVWLDDELADARDDARWLLLNYHRPMFPAVKEPAAAAPFWVPTFERHDVDLVLESDGHVMKRTTAVRDGAPDRTGVTYIGEGGLGVPQRIPNDSHWYFGGGGFVARGHHVTLVRFDDDALTTRFFVLDDSASRVDDARALVPRGATWRYLAGSDPSANWIEPAFDDAQWPSAPAGFGDGDGDDTTVLEDMRGSYSRVHLRARFDVAEGDLRDLTAEDADRRATAGGDGLHLALAIDYDDGFVAFLNGVEVARSAVASGRGAAATDVTSHEAGTIATIDLTAHASLLRPTGNVLAVEGHNVGLDSSDFSLHPALLLGRFVPGDSVAASFAVGDEHRIPVRPR